MAAADHWPRFVPAARQVGFASVHALPMRVADCVLGALGLSGTEAGELNEADLLVGRSLACVASVASVQDHPPTLDAVLPHLRHALANRVVVEQAKGFLRERMDISVGEAFALLRSYAHRHNMHLSDLARRLMSEPTARTQLVADLTQFATTDPR